MKKLTNEIVRDLIDRNDRGKLPFSKVVQELNEWVFEAQEPEYIVCFYEGVHAEERIYQEGELIKVNEEEMFKWIEKVHVENIKIAIYTYRKVLDLS